MPNVTVTNKNKEAYSRRFDGELYEFQPNVPVTITEDTAAYLFASPMLDASNSAIYSELQTIAQHRAILLLFLKVVCAERATVRLPSAISIISSIGIDLTFVDSFVSCGSLQQTAKAFSSIYMMR